MPVQTNNQNAQQGGYRYPQQRTQQPQQYPQQRLQQMQQPQQYVQPRQTAPAQVIGTVPPSGRPPLHFLDKRMIIPLVVIILLIIAAIVASYVFKTRSDRLYEESYASAPYTSEPVETAPAEPAQELSAYDAMSTKCVRDSADREERDACFLKFATEHKDVGFCDQIIELNGPVSRDACYEMLAVYTGNSLYCQGIDAYLGDYSYHSCMVNVAKSTNRPNNCLALSPEATEYREDCISYFNMTEEQFNDMYGPDTSGVE